MRNNTRVMEHKGFKAKIMEADRLIGDQVHGLPPGSPLPCYHADAFKSYPENWMKGPGVFVVPVQPNKGLWFDWRDNDENNTAVIPTVKGCNPITGMQTTGFHLERYDNKCPKHGCNFEAHRFCPECSYKWPDRGYVSGRPMWWDGFRSEDGSVRQFFFTEEMMRDVATHMIGKENTVPAFGFAFYSPKVMRPSISNPSYIYHCTSYESKGMFSGSYMHSTFPPGQPIMYSSQISDGLLGEVKGKTTTRGLNMSKRILKKSSPMSSVKYSADCSPVLDDSAMLDSLDYSAPMEEEKTSSPLGDFFGQERSRERSFVPQKEVAVGAGAKIRQELPEDTNPLDSWKDTPDSVMTIYFVFQEEFARMAEGGFKDFSDCKDGMLNGLPVG